MVCQTDRMSKHQNKVFSQHVIIDGLEGDKVRVELPDGTTADWDRASLPDHAKEGDLIRVVGEGTAQRLEVDQQATAERREQAQNKLDALNSVPSASEIDL